MSVFAERPEWHAQAVCRGGTATNVFFPERGGEVATSRAMCVVCPVREECLNFALENGEKFGIWGGKSERERRVMRRVHNVGPKPGGVAQPIRHGTAGGYMAHQRRKESACDACRSAHAERQARKAYERDARWKSANGLAS